MKKMRVLLIAVLSLTSFCLLWAVGHQHDELLAARQNRAALLNGENQEVASETATTPTNTASPETSHELLRLRAEVTALNTHLHELGSVEREHQELLQQVAARPAGAAKLPPGYVKRSDARFVGYATPQATLESFLWAMQNRDPAALARAMTPETAQLFHLQDPAASTAGFFKQFDALIGLGIIGTQPGADGSIKAQVLLLPGIPPEEFLFQNVAGEWKLQWTGRH
jgi:hypothetical protein